MTNEKTWLSCYKKRSLFSHTPSRSENDLIVSLLSQTVQKRNNKNIIQVYTAVYFSLCPDIPDIMKLKVIQAAKPKFHSVSKTLSTDKSRVMSTSNVVNRFKDLQKKSLTCRKRCARVIHSICGHRTTKKHLTSWSARRSKSRPVMCLVIEVCP